MRNLLTLPSDGQYSGISWSGTTDDGDTPVFSSGFKRPSFSGFDGPYERGVFTGSDPAPAGSSVQSWKMADNEYSRFDPSKSFTQNYGEGNSFNSGSNDGASEVFAEAVRGK